MDVARTFQAIQSGWREWQPPGSCPTLRCAVTIKEAKQCCQATLRSTEFAKRGTLNESDYLALSYSLALSPEVVEQIFETHHRVTREIDVLGEIRRT
jgi:hypothetical protein